MIKKIMIFMIILINFEEGLYTFTVLGKIICISFKNDLQHGQFFLISL